MAFNLLDGFTDVLGESEEICDSQPLSLSPGLNYQRRYSSGSGSAIALQVATDFDPGPNPKPRPAKGTGQHGEFRSTEEIDVKYRNVFSYPFFNLVQSRVIDDALYTDKSMVVCAPTGSGKTVVFEMAIVQLLMDLEDKNETYDFKIIYIAPVKALCTERLTEWYSKFTKLGLLCIEVTGDTDVDFTQLKPYRIIITTPEKWDMLTRRWRDHRQLVEVIKLFLIDEVHILNDNTRGPVLEAVVSRMKTIESSVQSTHRIEQLQQQYQGSASSSTIRAPNIRFIAVSATVGNPEDVAAWLGTQGKPAVYYKFGDECRPVKLKRVVEGYHCAEGSSIFKFDLILNYKLWPIIQKYHNGKPTLIFCNTRKSVALTAETLAREITITFNEEQKARLNALASRIKTKKLQMLVMSGVGCHHAGLLYEERTNIEQAFRNRDLPILITTTTLAMGVNLPAHLVIIKNTQQYVNGAYQEYSISTILQMVGRAGRPQFDTEATAVIMTRSIDKPRYQALVGGSEPLQSYLHKRLPENLNSEAALGTVTDVAQCVQWLRSTFLSVRAAKDPKRYLGLPPKAPPNQISTKIEELCVKAMNGLATAGLITMDHACCIESTEAGRLMSIYYLDLETMKHIMTIDGSESLERLLWIVCECHELADMHLRMDERRCLNTLNRNNTGSTIRFPMKGKITTRQMKLNCVIQASLGCLTIPDPSLNQEATKVMRIADRVCKCLVAYVTRPALISQQPKFYSAVLNSIILGKCIVATLWENSPYVCKQLRGIGPTFSTLLASSGKINFMLLEESHPRDLERIMNKGPPAGNIIRKQISLLPKYQITATPVDEKVVTIELKLLNHHNLADNMDNLTAGATHKSYIIIGDSENTLLLLTSFKDTDLISVYDGIITFNVTRKYEFEHKIYAHCVSSTIAGIDANCDYLFKDIELIVHQLPKFNEDVVLHNNTPKRQSTITDTFRERKRKNTNNEIAHSKEKKKRENSMFEKFRNLKQSFGKTSQVLKDDLEKSSDMSKKILQDLTHLEHPVKHNIVVTSENITSEENYESIKSTFFEKPKTYELHDDDFTNDFIDEDKINNILCEIECEISKESKKIIPDRTKILNQQNDSTQKPMASKPSCIQTILNKNTYLNADSYKTLNSNTKRIKNIPKKSNFNFIDKLENNVDESEESTIKERNGFSDAIRTHIEKYLLKTKSNVKTPNKLLKDLLQDEYIPKENTKETDSIVIVKNSVTEKDNILGQLPLLEPIDDKSENSYNDKKRVSEINKSMKSVDLTINDMIIDCQTQKSNDELELPAVDLGKKRNVAEKADDDNADQINMSTEEKHCEVYSPIIELQNAAASLMLPESINNGRDQLTWEPEAKTPKLRSEICKPLVPSVAPHIDVIGNNYSPKQNKSVIAFQNTEFSYSSLDDYQGSTNTESYTVLEPSGRENFLVDIPAKVNVAPKHTSEVNNKPEFPGLELWKNYIKELTPLDINEVNKNNSHDNTSDNENNTELKILTNSLSNSDHFVEIKENLKLSGKNLNKKGIFTPPFKHKNTWAFEKLKPLSQLHSTNKDSFLLSENQIPTQSEMEITTNGNCMREVTKLNSDHPLSSLKHNNELTSAIEGNAYIADKLETTNINNDIVEVGTCKDFSSSDSQPLQTQHNCIKLHSVESTVSHLINSDKQQILPKLTIVNDHKTKIENILNYPEYLQQFTQQNNDGKIILPMTSKILEEQQAAENESFNERGEKATRNKNAINYAIRDQIGGQKYDKNYSKDKSQKHYISQYSFSTNKIGVSTQETADHVVRVIRKLRIDLDVTEIISESDKKGNNKTSKILDDNTKLAAVPNIETETKPDYNSTMIGNIERQVMKCNQIKYLNTGSKDGICEETKTDGNENDTDCNTSIAVAESIPLENECIKEKGKRDDGSLIEEDKIEKTMFNKFKMDDTLVERKSKSVESILQESIILENESIKEKEKRNDDSLIEEDKMEKTMFSKYKMDDITDERKSKSVESILEKYRSNLMRQRLTESIDCSQSQVNEKCSVGLTKHKPNRPFKISDIHRLNPSPLPEVLIEKPKAINVTECFNQLNPGDKQAKLEENKNFNVCETLRIHKMREQEYMSTKELTGQSAFEKIEDVPDVNPLHIDYFEEKDTVSDMDQSMFNPKALLQCFRKDISDDKALLPENFIPPPPEFSDHLNEPNTTRMSLPTDSYEPVAWEESVCRSQETPNTSIFQESQTELTPSKEIETWNLSRDERRQIYAFPGTSPYSFTMMHKQSVKIPSKAVESWSLTQEDEQRGKVYATPGLNPCSFTLKRKNEHGGNIITEKSVEESQSPSRNTKLKSFKFIRRNKYLY